jgi:hypothetical protein
MMTASGVLRCSSCRTMISPCLAVAGQLTRRKESPGRYSRAISSSEFGFTCRRISCTDPSPLVTAALRSLSGVTRGVTMRSWGSPTGRSL